jgi:hypothetical protein
MNIYNVEKPQNNQNNFSICPLCGGYFNVKEDQIIDHFLEYHKLNCPSCKKSSIN